MAESSPRADRPLDALRRATFAHAAHIDLVRAFDGEPGEAQPAAAGQTSPSASAALKPKRKARQR